MDPSPSGELCPLCFRIQLDFQKLNDVKKKIEKYLQIKMEYTASGICLTCFNSIEAFHEFYEKVHAVQENLQKYYNKESEKLVIETESALNFKIDFVRESYESNNKLKADIEIGTLETEEIDESDGKNVPKEDLEDVEKVPNSNSDDVNKIETDVKINKSLKNSKLKEITSEVEKKMLEFYNIKCEKCEGGKFTSFKMLSKHYMSVHNTLGYIKCCKRNIRVNDKYYLRSHMFKHLQPDTCKCRVCGKELSSLATLKHHMILHKPTEERPFVCSKCSKRFCCKNDLKNHEKAIHLPENEREDFICDVCGKVFQKVANLRYHHSTVHLQERKYICEICAKSFTTQSGLRTHINAAHSTLSPIQCHECNKWLKTKDTYQKHLQLHQNKTYPCIHCDKICKSSASLRSHLVKHSEERPYLCTICKKSFKTKTHLKNHSTQHLGGSPYKCPYCSKLFVNMSNYYTHRKRMHSSERNNKGEDKLTPTIVNSYETSEQVDTAQVNGVIFNYRMGKNALENYNPTFTDLTTVR